MSRIVLTLAALAVSFAASTAEATTFHFDSGSAAVNSHHVARHKSRVWVSAHRSRGRLVRGHYVWR